MWNPVHKHVGLLSLYDDSINKSVLGMYDVSYCYRLMPVYIEYTSYAYTYVYNTQIMYIHTVM